VPKAQEFSGVGCRDGFPLPVEGGAWGRGCAPSPENFSLLTLEKAHFGGYLMHFEVVVCCAQDAARLCDRSDQFCQFFSDRLQFMGGLSP